MAWKLDPNRWEPHLAQERWMRSPAFEACVGGAAGPGKSAFVLVEALRHVHRPGYKALILRRTAVQLKKELIPAALDLYPRVGGVWRASDRAFVWPTGARIMLDGAEGEQDVRKFSGLSIQYLGFDELTHFCMVPETEVLTSTGWRRIDSIEEGDLVLSMAQNKQASLERVTKTWCFDYEGDLVETKSQSIRYSVTPNHKMVISGQRNGTWRFCRADKLPAYPMYPFDHQWRGRERSRFTLPATPEGRGHGANANSAAGSMPMDDWLAFLGWYLAEGSAFLAARSRGGTSPCVSLRQTKPAPDLAALIQRLPWRSRPDGDGGWRIFSRQLHDLLKPMGDAYTKRVPRWVFDLSARQLRIFFDAFARGDGHISKTGSVAFGLANEGLIDDLQEIAVKLGHRATKGYAKVRGKFDCWRLLVHGRRGGLLQDRPENRKTRSYRGKVHCITVTPHHTFLARYQGRVFWTGNSEFQYLFMFARLRVSSLCPEVIPRIRSGTNPGSKGHEWVLQRFAPFLYPRRGHPKHDPTYKGPFAEPGELLWYLRDEQGQEHLVPASTPGARSRTFFPGRVSDNPVLAGTDYEHNLNAMQLLDRLQLRDGDWMARPSAGMFFKRAWFDGAFVDARPARVVSRIRYWDLAATPAERAKPGGAWTAGVLLSRTADDVYWIEDIVRGQWSPGEVEKTVRATAESDPKGTRHVIERDPGQAGPAQALTYARLLKGFDVRAVPPQGDKITRCKPASAQAEAGNFRIVSSRLNPAPWVAPFFREAEAFPEGAKDQIDSLSGAFNQIVPLSDYRGSTAGGREMQREGSAF